MQSSPELAFVGYNKEMNVKFHFALLGVVLTSVGSAQNVLVWSTGNEFGDTAGVAAWLQSSGAFTSVTGINDDTGMTQSFLNSFDRVLYFSNSGGNDPVATGNLLGGFAGTGKRLVIATFAWANQGSNTLQGSIVGMMPFNAGNGSLYSNVTIGSTDGGPFWTGVSGINGFYHDDVTLVRGTLHGTWSDNEPLLASYGEIVNVNLFPDDSWGQVSGDHRRLFVNALAAPVPEPASLAAQGLGLLALRRRRR